MQTFRSAIDCLLVRGWTHMLLMLARTITTHPIRQQQRRSMNTTSQSTSALNTSGTRRWAWALSCLTTVDLVERVCKPLVQVRSPSEQQATTKTAKSVVLKPIKSAPQVLYNSKLKTNPIPVLANDLRRAMATSLKTADTARIVVVGAGTAGIAAATRLLEAGFTNVLLLEAENRIGGRVYTVPFADSVVDLGAQWCHGEGKNPVYELVQKLDLLEETGPVYDDYVCVRSNGEIVPESVAEELKCIAFNSIPERQKGLRGYEGSLGAYLTETFWRELEAKPEIDRTVASEFFDNFKKFESSVEASDHLFEVSGKGHLEYWLCEGEILLNWKDKGYGSFLRLLMKADAKKPNDLGVLNKRVLYNRRVENIDWRGADKISIKCWNGEIIEADHVICTASLGVLKENYPKMFTPPLPPAKCRAIEGLKLGTVDKFFLEFEKPFEPAEWTGFSLLWREEDLAKLRNSEDFWLESVIGFYRVSYQPRLLQGWIIGPHARYMETLPEKQVLRSLMWLIRKFLTFYVPDPVNFRRTLWHSNPNFRGSYTFRSMYTDELRTGGWDLADPITNTNGKPLVQFAGEATHNHYYSTVHGALESGWREAQRLITFYDQRPSQL